MNAARPFTVPRKGPRTEGEGVHAELMRQIGAKSYDPMPSTQHRWLMDVSNPPPMRIMGFLFSVTIAADKNLKRSAYGREPRGPVKADRVGAEFGWSIGRTNVYLRELEASGHIRIDEKGWIWLGGEVDEPRRNKGEYPPAPTEGNEPADLCTYIGDRPFADYLQQLSKNDADRGKRDAAQAAVLRTLELEALGKRAIAEATAAIRAQIAAAIDVEKRAVNFPVDEGRGRPRKERPDPVIQVTLLPLLNNEHKSEPISEQNAEMPSVQKESDCVQKCSYIEEQSREKTEKNSLPSLSLVRAPQSQTQASAPTPSNQQNSNRSPNEDPDHWRGLLFAASQASMDAPEGQWSEIREDWRRLSAKERTDALEGIKIRLESGQYGDLQWTPGLRRYMKEKLWTGTVRTRGKKGVGTSYLERVMNGEEEGE